MIKITLEPARNGVIKRVTDDNYGGAKQSVTILDVYENGSESNKFGYVMRFFYDLCEDLGMDLGNKFDREVLTFTKDWGSHYEATIFEVDSKISELEAEIELLKEWKKQQKENAQ